MSEVTQTNLTTFFAGLSATMESVREVRNLYNPVVAFEFNSLNFWRPGENKTSEILAFFLDPKEKHGQGDIFLRQFLKKINLEDEIHEKLKGFLDKKIPVKIKCEHGIESQRRIDILITFGHNKFALAIENKLWAIDQSNQLNDYNIYLKNNFQGYCLLYLSPKGQMPSLESISKENFERLTNSNHLKIISYQDHIIDCVHEWSINCRAERVRSFLIDFEQYLRQEINGEKFMNEHQIIVDYSLKNPSHIEAAFAVANSFGELKQELLTKFIGQLQEIGKELKQKHPDLDYKIDPEFGKESYAGFYLYKNSWTYSHLEFSFEHPNSTSFYYAIKRKDKSFNWPINIYKRIREILPGLPINNNSSQIEINEDWAWWSSFEITDWNNNSEPWALVVSGEMKNKIKYLIEDLLQKLEGIEL